MNHVTISVFLRNTHMDSENIQKEAPDLSSLMKKAQEGDGKSYELILREISPRIIKMVKSRIRDPETADDIFQTVLLNIHRSRHTFDPAKSFLPWLYSVTRNTVYDYLRKNRKKIELEVLVGDHFTAQAETSMGDDYKIVYEAINKLPEKYKEAVQLIKLDGLSMLEAAQKLGVSVSAMKVRAHRGYEKLKKMLIEKSMEEL